MYKKIVISSVAGIALLAGSAAMADGTGYVIGVYNGAGTANQITPSAHNSAGRIPYLSKINQANQPMAILIWGTAGPTYNKTQDMINKPVANGETGTWATRLPTTPPSGITVPSGKTAIICNIFDGIINSAWGTGPSGTNVSDTRSHANPILFGVNTSNSPCTEVFGLQIFATLSNDPNTGSTTKIFEDSFYPTYTINGTGSTQTTNYQLPDYSKTTGLVINAAPSANSGTNLTPNAFVIVYATKKATKNPNYRGPFDGQSPFKMTLQLKGQYIPNMDPPLGLDTKGSNIPPGDEGGNTNNIPRIPTNTPTATPAPGGNKNTAGVANAVQSTSVSSFNKNIELQEKATILEEKIEDKYLENANGAQATPSASKFTTGK